MRGRRGVTIFVALGALLAGFVGAGPAVAAGTAAPTLTSFTVGASQVDVTLKKAQVPVSMAWTANSPITSVAVLADPVSRPTTILGGLASDGTGAALSLTSGTVTSGTWTGTLTLPGGSGTTWNLSLYAIDDSYNELRLETADLVARGLPSSVRTVTTAVPPAPTGASAISRAGVTVPEHYVYIRGNAQVAGKPMATDWLVVNIPAGCGKQTWSGPGDVTVTKATTSWKICAYTVVALNAKGTSTGNATVIALI